MLYKNKLIRQLLQKRVLRGAMTMLFIVAAMPLWAQYNDIRYLTNSAAKLVQIDCEDDATLLYFTYDNTRPNTYLYVSDAIRLKVGDIDYYLKGAGNMPVSHDGGDKSVAGRAGKRLNFVLAFDKVPIDKPFDLIENELSTTAFNFHAIKVNTQLRTRRYDIDVFPRRHSYKTSQRSERRRQPLQRVEMPRTDADDALHAHWCEGRRH